MKRFSMTNEPHLADRTPGHGFADQRPRRSHRRKPAGDPQLNRHLRHLMFPLSGGEVKPPAAPLF
jgi:hypothetical protein